MSRVLFIASDYKPNPGGIAAYIDTLVRGLIGRHCETKVIAVFEGEDGRRHRFLDQYEDWVIPFEAEHDRRPGNWLASKMVSILEILRCVSPGARRILENMPYFRASVETGARLMKIIAKERPEVVVFGHLDLKFYTFALSLLEQGVQYGLIAHDFEVFRFPNRWNDVFRRGLILKGARWITANSNHTKGLVAQWGIPDENIRIVHPPASIQAIESFCQSRLCHQPKSSAFTLLSVCRLVRPKGVDIVLRSLRYLEERGIPYRYIVGGDGPERVELERFARELGASDRVQFVGSVSEAEKWRLFESADVYVMPSRVNPSEQHEGFGLAFIEAAAFGVPGVGANAGGMPEAVLHDVTGLLVEPESPRSLADALVMLYQNPQKRFEMGQAAMRRAKRDFSPQAIAAQFEQGLSSQPSARHATVGRTETWRGVKR